MKQRARVCGLTAVTVVCALLAGCGETVEKLSFSAAGIAGEVLVQTPGSGKWVPVNEHDEIGEGCRIRTGPGGRGTFSIPGKAVFHLAPETEVTLQVSRVEKVKALFRLLLHGGDTMSRVEEGAARYYVVSPIAIMGVIGTGFRVTGNAGGPVRAAVYDGAVSISKSGRDLLLQKGQSVLMHQGKPLEKPVPFSLAEERFNGLPVYTLLDMEPPAAEEEAGTNAPPPGKEPPPTPDDEQKTSEDTGKAPKDTGGKIPDDTPSEPLDRLLKDETER